jgi:hypothetical protein
MKKLTLFIGTFIILLISFSCKKDFSTPQSISTNQIENKASIPPFPFAWETADYMPTPPGISILVPWASGSNKNFPIDIAYDFLQSDGWELVYQTFNTTALTSPSYFALYNRYRGLLRYYLYLFPNSPTASTYVNHGIDITGSATPHILNYIGQDIVDVDIKQRSTTGIQNYQLQSTGGWYVMQYEIAYDPTIATTPYQNLNFQWYSKSINITEVNLSGQINGTLKGTITQPGSTPTLTGTGSALIKAAWEGFGISILSLPTGSTGLAAAQELKLKEGINAGISGVVKNLFSALFGGSSGSTQQVSLNLNAQIGLNGSLTNSIGLANIGLVIPGLQDGLTSPGYTPGYNNPMGIFYLSAKPKVNIVNTIYNGNSGCSGTFSGGYGFYVGPRKHDYSIDNSSFSVLFNPSVINSNPDGAQIQNYDQKLVLLEPMSYTSGSYYCPVISDGLVESVGNYTDVRVGLTNSVRSQPYYGSSIPVNLPHGNLAIRVSFDVVPNNGAPSTKIIKTFWADRVFL